MNINLGKIILLSILPIILYGNLILKSNNSFIQGEPFEFSLEAYGNNIQMPKITTIDNMIVQNIGTSTQLSIINGSSSKKLVKSYAFIPAKDFTIPAFSATIDGKKYTTKPKHIKMKKAQQTKSDLYSLDIVTNKSTAYVGEAIKFTLTFKYKADLPIVNLQLQKPAFEDFWIKELKSKQKQQIKNGYVVQKINYIIFAQKAKQFLLNPIKLDITLEDNRYQNSFFLTTPTKTISIFSNSLKLDIKPLPNNINLIGDFKISSTINKQQVNFGEAVSYKLQIQGYGNIDDIGEIKLNIPNATIYENKAIKDYTFENNKYGGTYTKTYSIVAQDDFVIPKIKLQFFNKKQNKIITLFTKEYKIKVKSKPNITNHTPTLLTKQIQPTKQEKIVYKTKDISLTQKLIYFILGVLCGIFIAILLYNLEQKKQKNKNNPIHQTIKNAKTAKQLLNSIVAFVGFNKKLDNIIFDLEQNSSKQDLKKLKKTILKILDTIKKDKLSNTN